MKVRLYHKDLGIPSVAMDQIAVLGRLNLAYSRHAQVACLNDRYGVIVPPRFLDTDHALLIEVETSDGMVSKLVVRMCLDDRRDLCLAIIPQGLRSAFVKTVWVNLAYDNHRTLDARKYDRP